jgi:hypothetical protein
MKSIDAEYEVQVGYWVPRNEGSWNDDNTKMMKVMVKSSKGVDDEQNPNVEGSP